MNKNQKETLSDKVKDWHVGLAFTLILFAISVWEAISISIGGVFAFAGFIMSYILSNFCGVITVLTYLRKQDENVGAYDIWKVKNERDEK